MDKGIWMDGWHYVYSDAGREATRPDEENDCVVISLALICGLPYSQMHEFVGRETGRIDRHPVDLALWEFFFPRISVSEFGSASMRNILPKLGAEKSFLIEKADHILPLIKGTVYDTYCPKPLERVKLIWEATDEGVNRIRDLVLKKEKLYQNSLTRTKMNAYGHYGHYNMKGEFTGTSKWKMEKEEDFY